MNEKELLEEDAMIFDLDNQTYIKDLILPALPEPAATVLLDNLKNLHQKKGIFVESSTEPKEKIVIDKINNRQNIIGPMLH